MNSENYFLNKAKRLIEENLAIGPSEQWQQRDYDYLVEQIFKKTQIMLSLSTIKRIWKNNYSGRPQTATLNALAKYLDYESWNSFKTENYINEEDNGSKISKKKFSMRYIYIVLPIILLIMIVIAIKSISSPDFSLVKLEGFNSLKSGIPNNIKIQYEVPKNTELSKWSISAEWSPFENSRLSGYKGEVNLISYYPGYHTTVIQYDGEPVKSIHNFVRTKGWLGIYRDNLAQKIPTYLESKDFINNSKMHLSESLLAKYSETNLAEAYFIEYFNIREFDELTGDNFALSTRFKNSLEDGGKLCQYLILYIYCENDNIIIPFCAPGCIGKIGLKISDSIIKGRESDMRFFGLNMDKWNQLDLEISDLKVKISINSKTILNMSYKNILGLIKGVHYRFYGLGSVDYLLLTASDKKEIYIDNFESPPNDLN